jgi:hypothetical protein
MEWSEVLLKKRAFPVAPNYLSSGNILFAKTGVYFLLFIIPSTSITGPVPQYKNQPQEIILWVFCCPLHVL